jgi:hypothetical protein
MHSPTCCLILCKLCEWLIVVILLSPILEF